MLDMIEKDENEPSKENEPDAAKLMDLQPAPPIGQTVLTSAQVGNLLTGMLDNVSFKGTDLEMALQLKSIVVGIRDGKYTIQ